MLELKARGERLFRYISLDTPGNSAVFTDVVESSCHHFTLQKANGTPKRSTNL